MYLVKLARKALKRIHITTKISTFTIQFQMFSIDSLQVLRSHVEEENILLRNDVISDLGEKVLGLWTDPKQRYTAGALVVQLFPRMNRGW